MCFSDLVNFFAEHLVTPFNAKAMAMFSEKINGKFAAILTVNTDKPPAKIAVAFFDRFTQILDQDFLNTLGQLHRLLAKIIETQNVHLIISREAIVQLIGNTKTSKGLKIQAQLDYREYEKGREVDEEDFKSIGIVLAKFHGEWNYTISPMRKIEIAL